MGRKRWGGREGERGEGGREEGRKEGRREFYNYGFVFNIPGPHFRRDKAYPFIVSQNVKATKRKQLAIPITHGEATEAKPTDVFPR